MVQSNAIPFGAVGQGRGVHLKTIIADRLNDAPTVEFDPSSTDQYGELARRLSAVCDTVITVGWSALQFEISAVREDGAPLADRMQEAFQNLLRDESDRSLPLGL